MSNKDLHNHLFTILKVLPTDYKSYGGIIERWEDESKNYPDCSAGCKHFLILKGDLGNDWGVCSNKNSHRAGLLTFEHQAGYWCFEKEDG